MLVLIVARHGLDLGSRGCRHRVGGSLSGRAIQRGSVMGERERVGATAVVPARDVLLVVDGFVRASRGRSVLRGSLGRRRRDRGGHAPSLGVGRRRRSERLSTSSWSGVGGGRKGGLTDAESDTVPWIDGVLHPGRGSSGRVLGVGGRPDGSDVRQVVFGVLELIHGNRSRRRGVGS